MRDTTCRVPTYDPYCFNKYFRWIVFVRLPSWFAFGYIGNDCGQITESEFYYDNLLIEIMFVSMFISKVCQGHDMLCPSQGINM